MIEMPYEFPGAGHEEDRFRYVLSRTWLGVVSLETRYDIRPSFFYLRCMLSVNVQECAIKAAGIYSMDSVINRRTLVCGLYL